MVNFLYLLVSIWYELVPSDILNVVTIVTFGVQHRNSDGFVKGEAFWMTVFSTVISTITNLTLIWDLVVTPNFAEAGMSAYF